MFCTGGIRCEKATALMLELGFENVYHLEGGILNYLESVPDDDNRWDGECFVFDTRVAVDRDLAEGGYVQCHACRRPLSGADLESPDYVEGVSCPQCINETDADKRARLEERARQVRLANERGESHVGAVLDTPVKTRRVNPRRRWCPATFRPPSPRHRNAGSRQRPGTAQTSCGTRSEVGARGPAR